ncbi:MAG: hypothetical protein WDN08_06805 [Rhizomicrobium sp.]
MKEIDIIQAFASCITLSYTAGQWWITVTTALLVATYFAAKHIRPWFFAAILLLYLFTCLSVVLEEMQYNGLAQDYGVQLVAFRIANHIPDPNIEPFPNYGVFVAFINYAVFILGSFGAATYSFLHWRGARKA